MLRYEEKTDNDRNKYFVISKLGNKHIIVIRPNAEDVHDAEALAKSLEYFDQSALMKYLGAVEEELSTYELHAEMKKEITEYLKGYSRWVVSVLISNSGAHPISFSPNATLYCNTRGTSLGDNFSVIDLQVRKENGDLDPITVQGGDSKAVSFVSNHLILIDDKWQQLLELFASSSRNCFVVLHGASDRWLMRSDLQSPLVTFGPSSRGQRLTDREISRRFGE